MAGGKGKLTGKDNTNGFQKNPQNINKSGANRKSFSSFLKKCKENGVEALTQNQYLETLSFIFQLNEGEIKELATDKTQPLALRLLIAEMTETNTRGKTLIDLRDYLFHKGISENKTTVEMVNIPIIKFFNAD